MVYVNPNVDHISSKRERFSALSPKVVAIERTTTAKLSPEEAMFINRMTVKALINATCAGELKVNTEPLVIYLRTLSLIRMIIYVYYTSPVEPFYLELKT